MDAADERRRAQEAKEAKGVAVDDGPPEATGHRPFSPPIGNGNKYRHGHREIVVMPPKSAAASSSSASSSSEPLHRETRATLNTPQSLLNQFSVPLPTRQYSRQYAALYDFRLRKLRRGRLIEKAKRRWEAQAEDSKDVKKSQTPRYTPRILDVQTGQVSYITGIVYTEMKLKPDVLQDLTREQYLPPLPPVQSYVDPASDSIYLEDESGRLKLVGPIFSDPRYRGAWITGTVGAFLGTELESGEFRVRHVLWPGLPSRQKQIGRKSKKARLSRHTDLKERDDDEYVVLLSGLDLGSSEASAPGIEDDSADLGFARNEMRLALLTEWLSGEIGDDEHRKRASKIAGVVIAGNLMAVQKADAALFNAADPVTAGGGAEGSSSKSKSSNKASASAKAAANLAPSPPSVLLSHLLPLAASLPIVLMPGATDPAGAALPQQGVHRAILQGVGKWSGSTNDSETRGGIELYTNPSWIQFGSSRTSSPTLKILATSGQNLDDLMKYVPSSSSFAQSNASAENSDPSSMETDEVDSSATSSTKRGSDRLTSALRLLSYSHLAPTAPDTLWCFPFTDRDPFIIDGPPPTASASSSAVKIKKEKGEQEGKEEDDNDDDDDDDDDEDAGPRPHLFILGNQPDFETALYHSDSDSEDDDDDDDQEEEDHLGSVAGSQQPESEPEEGRQSRNRNKTRVVLLPRFSQTGVVALVNVRTRAVEKVRIGWEM